MATLGTKLEVTVVRTADFGAFVQVMAGIEGLIHISELSEERVERVEDVVKEGQTLEAMVISFDRARQRIGSVFLNGLA